MNPLGRWLLLMLASSALAGCGAPGSPTSPLFDVTIRVMNDDASPVEGAEIASEARRFGRTGSEGVLELTLEGREGQRVPVTVSCPAAFVSPAPPLELRLTRLRPIGEEAAGPIRLDVVCRRRLREVVLVVQAENGSALPIQVDGKPLAVTDALGNAHVRIPVDQSLEMLHVSLDTSARPLLTPQNPSRAFALNGTDAILIFEPELTEAKPRQRPQTHRAPARHVPYRLD